MVVNEMMYLWMMYVLGLATGIAITIVLLEIKS